MMNMKPITVNGYIAARGRNGGAFQRSFYTYEAFGVWLTAQSVKAPVVITSVTQQQLGVDKAGEAVLKQIAANAQPGDRLPAEFVHAWANVAYPIMDVYLKERNALLSEAADGAYEILVRSDFLPEE